MSEQTRFQIYAILIFLSAGLMFGRIVAVDSVPDRTIQEARLALIPNRLAQRRAELTERGVSPERIEADLKSFAHRMIADAKKERPTLSANDRSRWLTIRALVEPDARVYRYLPLDENGAKKPLYKIGEVKRNCRCDCPDRFEKKNLTAKQYVKEWVPYAIDKAMETPGWETIDMVKHTLKDEEYDPANPLSGYLYSSKPTLLPTLMAAPYWLIYNTTGLSLAKNPFVVTRILLVVLNLIPLVITFFYMAKLIDQYGTTDWGRIFAVSALVFATFLSPFVTTLNNHLPGVVCIVLAVYAVNQILSCRPTARIAPSPVCLRETGASSAEQQKTPSGIGIADGKRKTRYFFCAGLFGALAVACELPAALIALFLCAALLLKAPAKTLLYSVSAGLLVVVGFFGTNYAAHGIFKPAYAQKRDHLALARAENPNDPDSFQVHSFDPNDWYVYRFIPAGRDRDLKNARASYWSNRIGIDRGEPLRTVYALHASVGHHGVFSLTPVWILSMIGLIGLCLHRRGANGSLRCFAWAVLAATVIFFVFYVSRDQGDRSYGGVTCALRWFFPLIPFWILAMLPTLDKMASRRSLRGIALALLFLSALSVAYPTWNPWSHPWLYHAMIYLGWL